MALVPIGRTYPTGGRPQVLHGMWLEAEEFAYPNGGFFRRAYVIVRRNPNRDDLPNLPYGERRVVLCSVPDTYFSIPAKLVHQGRTVRGFISVQDAGTEESVFTFTPDGKGK